MMPVANNVGWVPVARTNAVSLTPAAVTGAIGGSSRAGSCAAVDDLIHHRPPRHAGPAATRETAAFGHRSARRPVAGPARSDTPGQ